MENSVAKVRFVRCPKCHNLLPEFANVPMYKCGGCGTVLRAKHYASNKESASLESPVTEYSSRSVSENESCHGGSITTENTDISSMRNEEEHATEQSRSSASLNAENYCHEGEFSGADQKKESANHVSCPREERGIDSSSLPGFSSKDEDGSIQAKAELSFSEEKRELPDAVSRGSEEGGFDSAGLHDFRSKDENGGRMTVKTEYYSSEEKRESADAGSCHSKERKFSISSIHDFSGKDEDESIPTKYDYSFSEEEEEAKSSKLSELPRINSSSSPAASSSSSSSSDRIPDKYKIMSRRTFRHQWGSSPSIPEVARRSLGSQSFYSVQSSIGIENEGPSTGLPYSRKYFSECQSESNSARLRNLNQNRTELMKLVGRLKDQLHDLEEEKKPRSHFRQQPQRYQSSQMPVSYLHCHLQPALCCNRSSCRTCSYNFCCHSSKSSGPVYNKARQPKRYFRPVSGGAPFVTCYRCFEMLQMPADFLVSIKRLNKLKCGACSEILVLAFPARAHPVPQASTDHGNSSEGPISFSDEFGQSCSTENEPAVKISRVSSDETRSGNDSSLPLHRVMGYSSARYLL